MESVVRIQRVTLMIHLTIGGMIFRLMKVQDRKHIQMIAKLLVISFWVLVAVSCRQEAREPYNRDDEIRNVLNEFDWETEKRVVHVFWVKDGSFVIRNDTPKSRELGVFTVYPGKKQVQNLQETAEWLSTSGSLNLYGFADTEALTYLDDPGTAKTRNWIEKSRSRKFKKISGPGATVKCGKSITARITMSLSAVNASLDANIAKVVALVEGLTEKGKNSFTQMMTFGLPHCKGNPCDGQWTQHIVMEVSWDSVVKDYEQWEGDRKGRWVARTATLAENVKERFYLEQVKKTGGCS